MKLTEIVVRNSPTRYYTYVSRYYTDPNMERKVLLGPEEVVTSLLIDNIFQLSKYGIHHLTKPL